MGIDIYGWVEVNDGEWWPLIDIEELLGRNYDVFGMLFGAMNYTDFQPLASDASRKTLAGGS